METLMKKSAGYSVTYKPHRLEISATESERGPGIMLPEVEVLEPIIVTAVDMIEPEINVSLEKIFAA